MKKQKFSSTFFKRWRFLKAEPLGAHRSERNTLSFKRSLESLSLCPATFCKSKEPTGRYPIFFSSAVEVLPFTARKNRHSPNGCACFHLMRF
ncbi:MAG: hypothetical protein UEP78_00260 [Negativibacillus sp.]|nr:hypothetical protein [Negativibacillus sp.]